MTEHYLDAARIEQQARDAELWAAHRKAASERTKAWVKANPEKHKANVAKYQAANPDKRKAIVAKYQANKKAELANLRDENTALRAEVASLRADLALANELLGV